MKYCEKCGSKIENEEMRCLKCNNQNNHRDNLKKKNYTWLKIFGIVCVVAIAIICAIENENSSDNFSNSTEEKNTYYEEFKNLANLSSDVEQINTYQNDAKYIAFEHLDKEIHTIMLYESDVCWIYYNETNDSYKGNFIIKNNVLIINNHDGKEIASYKIIKGGIEGSFNGVDFLVEPSI